MSDSASDQPPERSFSEDTDPTRLDRFFREAFEHSRDAIGIARDGKTIYANQAHSDLFGFDTPDDQIGDSILDRVAPDRRPRVIELLQQRESGGAEAHYVSRGLRRDGTEFDMSVSLSEFQIGEDLYSMAFIRDVTEELKTKRDLEVQRSMLVDAEAVAGLGSWEFEFPLTRPVWSAGLCRIFGLGQEETPADWDEFLELMHPDDKQKVISSFEETMAKRRPIAVTHRIVRSDGQVRTVRTRGVLDCDGEGKPLKMLGTVLDITEIKQREAERAQLEEQLQRTERLEALGTMAGGVAHDFNNLLQGILGNVSLLIMDLVPGTPGYEELQQIAHQARRGAQLTSQLLGLARGGQYDLQPVEINDLIQAGLQIFTRTHKDVELNMTLAPDCWRAMADPGQIELVLLNLLLNAGQAVAQGGSVQVTTRNLEYERSATAAGPAPGRYVCVGVSDSGCGMDEETQRKAFDPFFTTRERDRGTGLGLATAYGIVTHHDGWVGIDSREGEGTSVEFWLPATDLPVEKVDESSLDAQPGSGTVLLVDDEKMVLAVGTKMLERLGYSVIQARSGEEAIEWIRTGKTDLDLVILDMIMPGLGGLQTFDAIRAMAPDLKVVLSSGYSEDHLAQEIQSRGGCGFIQKPFSVSELAARLAEILSE